MGQGKIIKFIIKKHYLLNIWSFWINVNLNKSKVVLSVLNLGVNWNWLNLFFIENKDIKKPTSSWVGFLESGSSTWARTRDLRINSPSLYRLSYGRIDGSPTWARTRDLRINSPSLYRLSYWRIWCAFYGWKPKWSSEMIRKKA